MRGNIDAQSWACDRLACAAAQIKNPRTGAEPRLIARLEREKRVTAVPYNPEYPVHTGWDLGIDDQTAVWFAQIVGREIRIIDYIEMRGRVLA